MLIQILFFVGKSEIPCLKSVPLEYIKSLINIGDALVWLLIDKFLFGACSE